MLLVIALFFAVQWPREIIPALLSGYAPRSVTDAGLLTSPVHVLDLYIVPAFVVTGIMLLRRKSEGFVLAPVLMGFAILMIVAVAGMMAFTWVQKLPGGGMIGDHRLSSRDSATEVELSFTSKGLFAHIVGKMFSKLISDYVATEAKSLKSRCDSLAHH